MVVKKVSIYFLDAKHIDYYMLFWPNKALTYNKKTDKHKLYALHASEVICIAKGKAHKPYEFGCKVSVISTAHRSKGGQFVLGSTALHDNAYDGHTLKPAIDEYEETVGVKTERIYVDKK